MIETKSNLSARGSKNSSALFLGRLDCETSLALNEVLISYGFNVKMHLFSGRKDLIMPELLGWKGITYSATDVQLKYRLLLLKIHP